MLTCDVGGHRPYGSTSGVVVPNSPGAAILYFHGSQRWIEIGVGAIVIAGIRSSIGSENGLRWSRTGEATGSKAECYHEAKGYHPSLPSNPSLSR